MYAVELKPRATTDRFQPGTNTWDSAMNRHFGLCLSAVLAALAFAPLAAFADPPAAPITKTNPSFPPNTPTPAYPKASRKAKEAGMVKAMVCIDPTGHVTKADIAQSSGHPNLDNAVLQWLRTVKLNPATENGQPVDVCDYPLSYEFIVKKGAYQPPTRTTNPFDIGPPGN
ncbi:MAG: energy transducer TonB [Betaproteobacteria bacterium]